MTKPYQTATPEQRPVHNVPETYTVKRMKTLGLWTAGVLVAAVGWILADLTGWAWLRLLALIVADVRVGRLVDVGVHEPGY